MQSHISGTNLRYCILVWTLFERTSLCLLLKYDKFKHTFLLEGKGDSDTLLSEVADEVLEIIDAHQMIK